MRTLVLISIGFVAIALVLNVFTVNISSLPASTAQAQDSVYLGAYIHRFDDTERGITCYTTGPSGIDCLPTITKAK